MKHDPDLHHRRSIRLKGYDYSQAGLYFITICTQNRLCVFGEIKNGEMVLNEYGRIVKITWEWLKQQYEYIDLGKFIVMPNHFHGIIELHNRRGGSRTAPTTGRRRANKDVISVKIRHRGAEGKIFQFNIKN